MSSNVHDRIESLAGAIALGEATDEQRQQYREHIATCRECLNALGGEREIERVAATVASARESEVWEPELRDVVGQRVQRRTRALRLGFGLSGVALAVSLGVHLLLVSGVAHLSSTLADPLVINAGATRIVLEQRASSVASKPAPVQAPPQRRLIVTHNVVQIARAPIAPVAAPPVATQKITISAPQIAEVTVHPEQQPQHVQSAPKSNVPIWRRNGDAPSWRTVARTTTTSLTETAPQTLTHSAESIHVASAGYTRDAAPIGGETAINPQPPMIAYDEGAEGTTVFEVHVDERGAPTKCIITKPAGYPVLDEAVCNAAMKAHFAPKLVNGRAVPGVYKDAFTFRVSSDAGNIEGVPKQIQ